MIIFFMKKYVFNSWWSLQFFIKSLSSFISIFFVAVVFGIILFFCVSDLIGEILLKFFSLTFLTGFAHFIWVLWFIFVLLLFLKSKWYSFQKMREVEALQIERDLIVVVLKSWVNCSYKRDQVSLSFYQDSNRKTITIKDLTSVQSYDVSWIFPDWFSCSDSSFWKGSSVASFATHVYDLSLFSSWDWEHIQSLLWKSENIPVKKVYIS